MKNLFLKSLSALLLISTLLITLISCSGTPETTTAQSTDSSVSTDQTPALDTDLQIRVAVLSGATGYGAVKLMNDAENKTTALNYQINAEASAKVIQDSLIADQLDLAALPTNKAALIANTTDGDIQVVAVNTLGVMYLVTTDGSTISTFEELRGKTVGIPEEPSYILKALCEANGLIDGTDLTISTYATPGDLVTAVVSGQVTTAVLPEPLLSTAMSKKDTIRISMNLTEQWENIYTGGKLMQGCIVVRTEWAEAHPAELAKFLEEYKASVEFVISSPAEAAPMVETYFGTAAAVAEKAIPRCNLTYLDGEEMKAQLQKLYDVLIGIPSASIGDKVPDDSFYYTKKA
ncbi:MAG: ABC transporter substrate-binding protein [Eubacteriales bacterium]